MRIPFLQIDAFADGPFTGNPAAVMPLEAWLDDSILQAIAAENNLAETAFTVRWAGDDADFELRWFTPSVEVALCGHATLAAGHALLQSSADRDSVGFATRAAGMLRVEREGDGYRLSLPAWTAAPKALPEFIALIGGSPEASYWRDGGYAMLLYRAEAEVRELDPDFRGLKAHGDIMFIATAPGEDTDIVSRVFVPGAGIDEDPVTGSAHCLLTTFWAERLRKASFTAYQASARGGHIACRLEGDRAILGGRCTTMIEGSFQL